MRRLGLDFDNTIVCYDAVFHRAALAAGLIPPSLARNKTAVRDYLRAQGHEAAWVALQGEVYGMRMQEAEPYPGLLGFLDAASRAGFEICIVSHKTRQPVAGPRWDLHAAARGWIGRFLENRISPEHVFLELTREDKLRRIEQQGCDIFVDDLPEVLLSPEFPASTRAVLFDPGSQCDAHPRYERTAGWEALRAQLLQPEAITT